MIHEFHNGWEVETPLGRGLAFMLESRDNDYFWNVLIFKSKAFVCFRQAELRATDNYSMGWGMTNERMREILAKVENESRGVSENAGTGTASPSHK